MPMPDQYRCPICGELQDCMTLPRSWSRELVATWRMLERNMACESPGCSGIPIPDLDDED